MKKKYLKRELALMIKYGDVFVCPSIRPGPDYHLLAAFKYQTALGRPLSEAELQMFIIHKKEKTRYLQRHRAKYLLELRKLSVHEKACNKKDACRHIMIRFRAAGFI